jgi:hypothetical protein
MSHQRFDCVPLRVALQLDAPISFVSSGVSFVWYLVSRESNPTHPCRCLAHQTGHVRCGARVDQ